MTRSERQIAQAYADSLRAAGRDAHVSYSKSLETYIVREVLPTARGDAFAPRDTIIRYAYDHRERAFRAIP